MENRERRIGLGKTVVRGLRIIRNTNPDVQHARRMERYLDTYVYSKYCEEYGLDNADPKTKEIKGLIVTVFHYWYWVDSFLDNNPKMREVRFADVTNGGISEAGKFAQVTDAINNVHLAIPQKEVIASTISQHKAAALEAHNRFMTDFDQSTATFTDVMSYRARTTGGMAEMTMKIIGTAAHASEAKIAAVADTARTESLGYQMMDDLIDTTRDYRQGLPNLFNALLLEAPDERKAFLQEVGNSGGMLSHKPYDLAQRYAPQTLQQYMDNFKTLISTLPSKRRQFCTECMGAVTYLGRTPDMTMPSKKFLNPHRFLTKNA